MRVQLRRVLGVAAVLAALSSGRAAAQSVPESRVATRVALYADDDETTVITSAVEAQGVVGETLAVRAGALVDVVTTASVDIVAAASRRIEETREEVRAGLDLLGDERVVSVDWARSVENDWSSHRFSLGGALDLAQHATRVSASVSLALSEVGRAGDPGFSETQNAHVLSLGVTQVIDARTLLSVGYSGQLIVGMQSSPYRFVPQGDGTALPETHPDRRVRHALVARVRRALGDRTSLGVDERLYADDWGLFASTTTVSLTFQMGEHLDVALENRLHAQTGVSFWGAPEGGRRRWVTADRELGPLVDDFVGPALTWERHDLGPFDRLRIDGRAQAFLYRFLDNDRIDGRIGTLVSLGLEGTL